MYRIAESLYCIPETNITLNVNSTAIKKKKLEEKREYSLFLVAIRPYAGTMVKDYGGVRSWGWLLLGDQGKDGGFSDYLFGTVGPRKPITEK